MMTNKEMRKEARGVILGKWVWRLMIISFVLQLIGQTISRLVEYYNRQCGIVAVTDFVEKKIAALQQGLDYTLPTKEAYRQMMTAASFEYFIATVFGAILLFGLTAVVLRAIKNDEKGWFASGLGGFLHPLSVTVLLLVQNVIVGFWSLFLLIPGIVMAYRYRFAWYLKCENPAWGALKCLGESAKMMKGYKLRAFAFDLHYIFLLFLLSLVAGAMFAMTSNFENPVVLGINSFVVALAIVFCFYVVMQLIVARATFYREVKAEREVNKAEASNDLPGND